MCVLHFRFKTMLCNNMEAETIVADISNILPQFAVSLPATKRKKTTLFAFLKTNENNRNERTETESYFQEECCDLDKNPLEYWKSNGNRYPALASLSSKYLCIQSSSTAVERMFSIAGKNVRPERSRLRDSVIESLMYVKANNRLF